MSNGMSIFRPLYRSAIIPIVAGVLLGSWSVGVMAAPKEKDAFDPLGFPGDSTVVTEDLRVPGQAPVRTASNDSLAGIVLQVQFLATTNLTEARDVRARAQESLGDTIYLEFETPYYKLRTGHFRDYDTAEGLAVRLRAMGYQSAWVVRQTHITDKTVPGE
jgi:hypothetical protein